MFKFVAVTYGSSQKHDVVELVRVSLKLSKLCVLKVSYVMSKLLVTMLIKSLEIL